MIKFAKTNGLQRLVFQRCVICLKRRIPGMLLTAPGVLKQGGIEIAHFPSPVRAHTGITRRECQRSIRRLNPSLACPPKPGPVLMGIVQLAESQGAIHAKTTQTGPDRGRPPRLPSRPRRRLEHHQACRKAGIGPTTYYRWKALQEDPISNEQFRVSELEAEVERLKLLVAELALDRRMLQEALKKKP